MMLETMLLKTSSCSNIMFVVVPLHFIPVRSMSVSPYLIRFFKTKHFKQKISNKFQKTKKHQNHKPQFSIYQSINLSIYQSINLSIYQSINLSIYQSINQSIYQSINQSIYQSIYLSINLSIYHAFDININVIHQQCRNRRSPRSYPITQRCRGNISHDHGRYVIFNIH